MTVRRWKKWMALPLAKQSKGCEMEKSRVFSMGFLWFLANFHGFAFFYEFSMVVHVFLCDCCRFSMVFVGILCFCWLVFARGPVHVWPSLGVSCRWQQLCSGPRPSSSECPGIGVHSPEST